MDNTILLEKLTDKILLQILADYGITPYKGSAEETDSNEIWFQTFCHGGDSHKLCYYKQSQKFYCYTNCGSISVFDIVSKLANVDFKGALKIIASYVGYSNRTGLSLKKQNNTSQSDNKQLLRYTQMRSKKNKQRTTETKLTTYSDSLLKYFENDKFYQGWINEGITINTMQKFEILWYELGNSIIIPHRNIAGELIGVRRRSLNEEDFKNKYMPLYLEGQGYQHPLNLNFYGLYQHKAFIKKIKKVVIVESEKAVMLAHSMYGDSCFVLATCGFNISLWHIQYLLELGIEEVILGFDKDFDITEFETYDLSQFEKNKIDKFNNYVKRIFMLAQKLTPYFTTNVIWDRENLLNLKDSPFDRGQEVLERLMKTKVEITTNDTYTQIEY